jgi:Protein of unknown function (DUF2961)
MPLETHQIARLRDVTTRSISPENFDGVKGGGGRATQGTGAVAARDLGVGWKISPSVIIASGTTFPMATIDGSGMITHVWLTTHHDHWRTLVLRAYWDHAPDPAIEVPLGDFFANGWGRFAQVSSSMIAVNPHGGFNSYWPMPFQSHAELPTICGTGTEDYFGGAWNFDAPAGATPNTPRPTSACRKSFALTASTRVSSASVSTVGTFRIRSISPSTCAWRSRPSAGSPAADICHCMTTSPQRRCSTLTGRAPGDRRSRRSTRCRLVVDRRLRLRDTLRLRGSDAPIDLLRRCFTAFLPHADQQSLLCHQDHDLGGGNELMRHLRED